MVSSERGRPVRLGPRLLDSADVAGLPLDVAGSAAVPCSGRPLPPARRRSSMRPVSTRNTAPAMMAAPAGEHPGPSWTCAPAGAAAWREDGTGGRPACRCAAALLLRGGPLALAEPARPAQGRAPVRQRLVSVAGDLGDLRAGASRDKVAASGGRSAERRDSRLKTRSSSQRRDGGVRRDGEQAWWRSTSWNVLTQRCRSLRRPERLAHPTLQRITPSRVEVRALSALVPTACSAPCSGSADDEADWG